MGNHFVRRAATSGAMLIAGTTAGLALYGPATAAFAYGNQVCTESVTPSPVQSGQSITVTVTGPAGAYQVALNHNNTTSPLGTVTVGSAGSGSNSFPITRSDSSGLYIVTASSGPSGCTASAHLTITPAPATLGGATGSAGSGSSGSGNSALAFTSAPPSHSALAFTGADIALTVAGGAAAVGVGGSLVLVSRRRRQVA